ncbi:MAG TPA: 2Fe-2S iron-sulfur cluster-binding protein [Oculatellaceae cyanobacterium]|jgi:ferredoxin
MPQIRVEPLGINLNVTETEVLLRSLKRAKVELDAVCGGQGTCGTCALQIFEGQAALSPMKPLEATTLQNTRKDPEKYRLTCQTNVIRDGAVCYLNNKAAKKLNQIFERLKDRRAPQNIIHPISGELLVAQNGIITQDILEKLLSR